MKKNKKEIKELIKGKKWTSVLWKYHNADDANAGMLQHVGDNQFYMVYRTADSNIILYTNGKTYSFNNSEKEYDSLIQPYLKYIA